MGESEKIADAAKKTKNGQKERKKTIEGVGRQRTIPIRRKG